MNRWLFFAAAMVLMSNQASVSADVRFGISSTETYVNVPVVVQVQLSDVDNFRQPKLPTVDGLVFRSGGTTSQIRVVNGRRSITYIINIRVMPVRPGTFTIPPLVMQVDGEEIETKPIELTALKSETGDLLFVEVQPNNTEVYVGQPIELTLQIWIRRYEDREQRIALSAQDMWQTISGRSQWGAFTDRITADDRDGITVKQQMRTGDDGEEHPYYLYEATTTIYPKVSGQIDPEDLSVVLLYPTSVRRRRDLFSDFSSVFGDDISSLLDDDFPSALRRTSVQSSRPIQASAEIPPINVKPIPEQGRPADYRGAVGKYSILTDTETSRTTVDEPVRLLIGIDGDGPLDMVVAPPLHELDVLRKNFKVPDEPLAGYVDGTRKVFSVNIRPRRDDVTEIPAIPFSYFDPEQEQFVTVQSRPIPLTVEPAESLQLDSLLSGRTIRPSSATSQDDGQASAELALSNYMADEILTPATSKSIFPTWLLTTYLLPPLVLLLSQLVRYRQRLAEFARVFSSSIKVCRNRIESASGIRDVNDALCDYFARQLGCDLDRDHILGALRQSRRHDVAVQLQRLFDEEMRSMEKPESERRDIQDIRSDALKIAEQYASKSDKRRVARGVAAGTASLLIAIGLQSDTFADEPNLSRDQQVTLANEASELYRLASEKIAADKDAASDLFAAAATKYQQLVDFGVRSDKLFLNLANSQLHAGQTAKAIANYRQTLYLDPENQIAIKRLAQAQDQLQLSGDSVGTPTTRLNFVRHWLAMHVPVAWLSIAAALAWLGLWAMVALRCYGVIQSWKFAAALLLGLSILFVAARSDVYRQLTQEATAVIIADSGELHAADRQSSPVVASGLRPGQLVNVTAVRDHWYQVHFAGQTGWIPSSDLQSIGDQINREHVNGNHVTEDLNTRPATTPAKKG